MPQLVEFPEQTRIIAKDQPEYVPMPVHIDYTAGIVTCCWKLTWRERLQILFSGRIWHRVKTFGANLQPQLILTEKPDLVNTP